MSSTHPISMMRSPFSADKPVVSVSRKIWRMDQSQVVGDKTLSMQLFGVIDGVFGYLDGHIGLGQESLAAQAGIWL